MGGMSDERCMEEAVDRAHTRHTTVQDLLASVECDTRVAILAALYESRDDVSKLAARTGIPLSLLSNHLRVLRNSGLVTFDENGQRRIYHLSTRAQTTWSESRLTFMLVASDGSNLALSFPRASHLGRSIEAMIGWPRGWFEEQRR